MLVFIRAARVFSYTRFTHTQSPSTASTVLTKIGLRGFSTRTISSRNVIKDVVSTIRIFLRGELRLQCIDGFIHKTLDKGLSSTPHHQEVYEAVVVYLIRNMLPQPAATVYDRMLNKGFISSDPVAARMLTVILADTQVSGDTESPDNNLVLQRVSHLVSNHDFGERDFIRVLNVAEDYNVRPRSVIDLIQTFIRGKGSKYVPHYSIIAASLRAAVKLGDVQLVNDILDKGDPTLQLSAIVEACGVTDKLDGCREKLGMRIVGSVANSTVQESDILRTLAVFSDVGMSVEIVARVCASFLANRDADYVPKPETTRAIIEAFIQADQMDDAFALLERVGIHPGNRPAHRFFLATLRDLKPFDHHSFARLLSMIDAAGIPLDSSLLNVVISREVRLNRAGNAFLIFEQMKQIPDLLPDSKTFGSLFSMQRRIRPAGLKRNTKMARVAYPLRELFRDFMDSCLRNLRPISPNTTLLNTALRAFMRQRDYAGAIVVIMSFGLFQVPLDNRSYFCVVKLLIRRIWTEIPRNENGWAVRFLGAQDLSDSMLNRSLAHEICSAVCGKRFDVSAPLHTPRRGRRSSFHFRRQTYDEQAYKFPTMQMMETLERPEPLDFVYDPEPLIRLLARAIYVDANANVYPEQASQMVEESVKKARGEMTTVNIFQEQHKLDKRDTNQA